MELTDNSSSWFKRIFEMKPRNILLHIVSMWIVLFLGFSAMQSFIIQQGWNWHPLITVFLATALFYPTWLITLFILDKIISSRGY